MMDLPLIAPILLPFAFVVFGMRQDVANVQSLAIEVNGDDQAILVATNVEHREFSHLIDAAPHVFANVGEPFPLGLTGQPIPSHERLFGVGMEVPKRAKGFLGDDMHRRGFTEFAAKSFTEMAQSSVPPVLAVVNADVRHLRRSSVYSHSTIRRRRHFQVCGLRTGLSLV
jgi:hypothetical protein